MFASCQLGGLNFGMPDVCLTPVPPIIVPVPYPNLAVPLMAIPPTASLKVLMTGMPAHNLMTTIPMTNGDNAGLNMGVMSGMVMGPSRNMLGSFTTLVGGMPAMKMTGMTGHNGMFMNCPGMALAPSQVKVIMMS